jgi:hypothetical protein
MVDKIHEAVPMNFKTIMEMKLYGKQYLANWWGLIQGTP